ncbi:zinc-binding dehydrogenase [Ktedonobacter racemifer]|uniref:Alcohol dehydrogenase zinc-binding domain protein n=1 Tax=Ktedonobacter racemifer DSM 44963 TaxID=485913 RepID=D6TUU3_KTERA|nr:zinc-binding dehydrogenase [Ktedonobacter racemifer]EFH85269.1 Alcohol dehydrogenase zinc-binding domain protein [Ktedonobacter racemifer DSM 44963]
MFAIVNTPKGVAPLEIREVAEPKAASNEVIVEVRAFSLNRGELALLAMRPEGWRPGQDIAGIVVQRAADGSGPDVGTRVVGMAEQEGWAQRVAVATDRLTTLPENISFAQAAALPMAGHTALRILRFSDPLEGKRVLITGAAGGVGHFAVQIAALGGAEVTGVVGRPERATGLRELGASDVVTQVEQARGPFDLILESVGGASLTAALGLVAPHGTVVVFGNSSGEDTPFNLYNLFGHEGVRLQTFFSFNPGTSTSLSTDLAQLVALVEAGKLTVPLGLERDWSELALALPALQSRQVLGKATFHVR